MIVDELMPVLYKQYNISNDPERHGIGGSSSGAIAAFTVAWERPNDFRKVLSNVGSFVNLRGGDAYPDIIRQERQEADPHLSLRWPQRQSRSVCRSGATTSAATGSTRTCAWMQALTDKGYDVNYAWGMNKHGQKMGGAILPDMMRWLWRDHEFSSDPNDAVERSFNVSRKSSGKN